MDDFWWFTGPSYRMPPVPKREVSHWPGQVCLKAATRRASPRWSAATAPIGFYRVLWTQRLKNTRFCRVFTFFLVILSNVLNQSTGLACWHNITPARACAKPGGIGGVRSLSIWCSWCKTYGETHWYIVKHIPTWCEKKKCWKILLVRNVIENHPNKTAKFSGGFWPSFPRREGPWSFCKPIGTDLRWHLKQKCAHLVGSQNT